MRSAPACGSARSSSTSSTAPRAATSAASSTAAGSSATSCSAAGPLAVNYRGLRLPLVGWTVAVAEPTVAPVAAVGLADDLWSGPERGFRAHLASGRTTGMLKLGAIPAYAFLRTRSVSAALLVGLAANALNQLDTRPGRALKTFLLASALARPSRRAVACAVLLLPYDLREMAMLGDAGSNALGAVLGFGSVSRLTGRGRFAAIAALAGLTVLGERRSLGELIERTPGLRELDALGRGTRGSGPAAEVRLRHGRRRLGAREGHRRRLARPPAQGARPHGRRRRSSTRT